MVVSDGGERECVADVVARMLARVLTVETDAEYDVDMTTFKQVSCKGVDTTKGHYIIVRRDNNRMGGHYGQHFYLEVMNGTVGKIEYNTWKPYDRDQADMWGRAVAKGYGAQYIADMPVECLYG